MVGNPNWKKGVSGNPKGRPKGAVSKKARELVERLERDPDATGPVEALLLGVQYYEKRFQEAYGKADLKAADKHMTELRAFAQAAAPYCAPKLAAKVIMDGGKIDQFEDLGQIEHRILADLLIARRNDPASVDLSQVPEKLRKYLAQDADDASGQIKPASLRGAHPSVRLIEGETVEEEPEAQ